MTTTVQHRVTFAELAGLEPRLAALLAEAQAVRDDGVDAVFCGTEWFLGWYGRPSFKRRLSALVGWFAGRRGVLGTSAAYDVAYRTVYAALPACRGRCACMRAG